MRRNPGIRGRRFLWLGLAALLLSGFDSRPALALDLTGTWKGTWLSQTNGHNGPMTARFKRINGSQYRVRFTGFFWKVIPFCYSETFDILSDDGQTVQLSATSDLCFFGTFHCRAAANSCHFRANYTAQSDQGQFTLRRTR